MSKNGISICHRPLEQSDGLDLMPPIGHEYGEYDEEITHIGGKVESIAIRSGIDVTIFDYEYLKHTEAILDTPECFEVCILFTGGGKNIVCNSNDVDHVGKDSIPNISDTSYVFLTKDKFAVKSKIEKDTKFTGICIRFLPEFLPKLKNFPSFESINTNHPLHYGSNSKFWVGMFKTPQNIRDLAQKIFNNGFSNNPNDLIIESYVLKILSDFIEVLQVIDNPSLTKRSILLSKDRRMIKAAQTLILSDIAHTWEINEISRKVGLNTKKLKQGFKSEFGVPIYSFLQQERMNKALELLKIGNLSITDVSLIVGYANPSHFAYLFKRKYGKSPSQVRSNELPTIC